MPRKTIDPKRIALLDRQAKLQAECERHYGRMKRPSTGWRKRGERCPGRRGSSTAWTPRATAPEPRHGTEQRLVRSSILSPWSNRPCKRFDPCSAPSPISPRPSTPWPASWTAPRASYGSSWPLTNPPRCRTAKSSTTLRGQRHAGDEAQRPQGHGLSIPSPRPALALCRPFLPWKGTSHHERARPLARLILTTVDMLRAARDEIAKLDKAGHPAIAGRPETAHGGTADRRTDSGPHRSGRTARRCLRRATVKCATTRRRGSVIPADPSPWRRKRRGPAALQHATGPRRLPFAPQSQNVIPPDCLPSCCAVARPRGNGAGGEAGCFFTCLVSACARSGAVGRRPAPCACVSPGRRRPDPWRIKHVHRV